MKMKKRLSKKSPQKKSLIEELSRLRREKEEWEAERERLIKEATIDPLTGIASRRAFEVAARREFSRADRTKEPVGMLFLDLDNFKPINDTYGHDKGDAILRKVASVLSQSVREGDLVARVGGDEFAVLLPNHGVEAVMMFRARLCGCLENKNDLPCISIGAASTASCQSMTFEELYKLADAEMYKDKESKKL